MLLDFIISIFKVTFIQLAGVFGIFFVFGFVLNKLQTWTESNYRRVFGWNGILFTAWFGTPFHELGHVFFAKIFRHRITKINLFTPNETTGGLGNVDFGYNKNSLYQKIGNFFVGAAPMIFGGVILSLMLYFLIPNGKEALSPLLTAHSFSTYLEATKKMFITLFSFENLKEWSFWLFLYLSFCVAAHISPSKQDRKIMWRGFIWIIVILFLINLVALFAQFDITKYVLQSSTYLKFLIGVFVYATALSLLHLIITTLLLRPFKRS